MANARLQSSLANSAQHLQSWKDSSDPAARFHRIRVTVAIACCFVLGTFLVVVGWPLTKPHIEFLSIGYTSTLPTADTENGNKETPAQKTNQWIAKVNAFAKSAADGWVTEYASGHSTGADLQSHSSGVEVQLVYLTGVLDIQGDELLLYASPDHAFDAKRGIHLNSILQAISLRSESTIVLLDLQLDAQLITGLLPEWTRHRTQQLLLASVARVDESHLSLFCNFIHPNSNFAESDNQRAIAQLLPKLFHTIHDKSNDQFINVSELSNALQQEIGGNYLAINCPAPMEDVTRKSELLPNPNIFPLTPASKSSEETASTPALVAGKSSNPENLQVRSESSPSDSSNLKSAEAPASNESSPEIQTLPVVAPTMTLAAKWHRMGLLTDSSDIASATLVELNLLAERPLGTQQAETWLAKERKGFPNWILMYDCREILQSKLAWSLQRRLVQAQLIFHRMCTSENLNEREYETLKILQGRLLDVQRQVASPIRADHERFMTTVIPQIYESLAAFERRVTTHAQAKALAVRFIEHPSEILDFPVDAASDPKDPVIELLTLVATHVTTAVPSASGSTPEREQSFLQSVERMRSLADSLQSNRNSSHRIETRSQPAEDDVTARTELRLLRLASWQEMAQQTFPSSSNRSDLPKLDDCRKTVSQYGLFSSQADQAMQQLQVDWRRLMRRTADAFLAWRSEENRVAPAHSKERAWAVAAEQSEQTVEIQLAMIWDCTAPELALLKSMQRRCSKIQEAAGRSADSPLMPPRYLRTELINGLDSSAYSELIVSVPSRPQDDHPRESMQLSLEFDPTLFHVTPITTDSNKVQFTAPSLNFYATAFSPSPGTNDLRVTEHKEADKPPHFENIDQPLRFQIQRLQTSAFDAGLVLRVKTGSRVSRTAIHLETFLPPFAELVSPDWEFKPNNLAARSLQLRCLHDATQELSVRLLAMQTDQSIPETPQPNEVAANWLEQHGGASTLAQKNTLTLTPNQISSLAFPAAKPKPGAPPTLLSCLLLELTDEKRGFTQWLPLYPRVARPYTLLAPEIDYDHLTERIQIQLPPAVIEQTEMELDGLRVFIEVFDLDSKKSFAKHSVTLSKNQVETIELSAKQLASSRGGIRIEVNEWPNAFLYTFRKNRSERALQLSDELVGVTFVNPEQTIYAQPDSDSATVQAVAVISDGLFRYKRDRFRVGVDANGDRMLDSTSVAEHMTPVMVRFDWQGINAKGQIQVRNRLAPQSFSIPLSMLQQERYGIVAELEHGNRVAWNVGPQVVIDGQKPTVANVEILSPLPALLGTSLLASVKIDDHGLSGPATVQAAWMKDGNVSLLPPAKPVPGQQLDDGGWKIQLPTSELVEGTHQLLIEAVDRAGNPSELKVVPIEILTKATMEARKANETTAVLGVVRYVNRPVPSLTVSLEPKKASDISETSNSSELNQTNAGGTSDTSRKILATVLTDGQGRFTFPAVPAGEYLLRVSGLYRGNNHEESVEIVVAPPTPTSVPPIRID